MLNISQSQLNAISVQCSRTFEQRAVQHLHDHHPAKCEGRDHTVLLGYVQALVAFASANGVVDQGFVLRLMDAQMASAFNVHSLSPYQRFRLSQPGIDEATRVRNFEHALHDANNPVVISLSTDLATLERARA